MPSISTLITDDQIDNRELELGQEITKYYEEILKPGESLVVVAVLKGAFIFCADLIRYINVPLTVEFISISSYGEGTTTSGEVRLELDTRHSLAGKHVLVVEDIVDTGLSLQTVFKLLGARGPASMRLCSLLSKPSRREVEGIEIDFLGFRIDNHFVIGYGLDYDEKYRELPFIGVLDLNDNDKDQ